MKKLFLSLGLITCLVASGPAGGGENTTGGMYPRPSLEEPKYYTCKEDKHCTTAKLPCGRMVILNVLYQQEVQGWADFVAPRFQCLGTVARQRAENIACVEGMCRGDITQIPQQLEDRPEHRNPAYCETIDDCAVVDGPCYKKILINKKFRKKLQDDYDYIRKLNMEQCLIPDRRTVERLHCRKNTCEADLKVPDQTERNKLDMRRPPKPN